MQTHEKKRLKTAAYRYAFTGLALNYYTQYEISGEQEHTGELFLKDLGRFHEVLGQFLDGGDPREELGKLRDGIIGRMEILTAYVDCFQIYEYVLNRVEPRFDTERKSVEDAASFTEELMEYLSASGDASIFNSRIQEVERQLPIRYTKQKFYSLLSERLTLYVGAEKKSVEDVFYMLRTSSMVLLPEGMEETYPDLYEFLTQLRKGNYRDMTKEQYESLLNTLTLGSQILNRESGDYLLLEEMVNELYAVLLSRDEALLDAEENRVFYRVTGAVRELFLEDDYRVPDDEVTALLENLEGIQESAYERLDFPEDGEEDIKNLSILLSGSAFVRLEEKGKTEGQKASDPADRVWLEKRTSEFCGELDQLFAELPKAVTRAVMANIISYLPVVFESREELREHIAGSLESCGDLAERAACMQLLRQELMEEDAFY